VPRMVGLVRAVNVAGRKLSMPDLRRLTELSGGRDVETYLQSGNVVFRGPKKVGAALESALRDELGLDARILLRTAAEMQTVVAGKPYGDDGTRVSVAFLDAPAPQDAVAKIDPEGYGEDRFVVRGREIYLHTPGGYGRTKLNNAFWERKLDRAATTRNWNSVTALAALAAD
jgi:uncharacterized protein (DUF1697 family)